MGLFPLATKLMYSLLAQSDHALSWCTETSFSFMGVKWPSAAATPANNQTYEDRCDRSRGRSEESHGGGGVFPQGCPSQETPWVGKELGQQQTRSTPNATADMQTLV